MNDLNDRIVTLEKELEITRLREGHAYDCIAEHRRKIEQMEQHIATLFARSELPWHDRYTFPIRRWFYWWKVYLTTGIKGDY